MDKDREHTEGLDDNGKFAQGNQLFTRRKRSGPKPKLARFVQAFDSVVNNGHPVGRAIIHSDKDLLRMTNRLLDEEDRISEASMIRYKEGDMKDMSEGTQDLLTQFQDIYAEALNQQRDNLFDSMTTDKEQRSWGRWAWIIERKFDEWNLRNKAVDETPDLKTLVFRVAKESGED